MRNMTVRLKGLSLLMLALAPPAVILGGVVFAGKLVFDAGQATRERIETVVETVNTEIVPRLEAIGRTYGGMADTLDRLNGQIDGVFVKLGSIQDLRIDAGQLGYAGARQIQVPSRTVSFGSGFAKIDVETGKLLNETLPAIRIPDRPVTIPIGPLREAFAPLGPGGPIGRAVQAAQGEIGKAVGEVKKLAEPVGTLVDTAAGWFGPLRQTLATLGFVITAMMSAVVLLIALYVGAGLWLAVRRRAEAAAAYRTGGELGYVLYVHRTLILDGFAQLRGRDPSVRTSTADLNGIVEQLRAEVADLRAELGRTRMSACAAE
ncbi:hypothetical protein IGS68_13875 [Skermanella sp. TT6]|uniref:Uncharacterized protein n=1 Tax=Skermanella cutis TaxID=2775420 RepID=A0ABX7BDP8_9PROT|nr:hypothetical protein [Skermanella sp. TT6]QQP92213.1 hypothetical protein IGS68_13875 [Skermanella sp. TT6]